MKQRICGIPDRDLVIGDDRIAFKKGKKYYGASMGCLESELSKSHGLGDWNTHFTFSIENVWEEGDVLVTKWDNLFIFKESKNGLAFDYVFLGKTGFINGNKSGACLIQDIKGLATEEQKQRLFKAMEAEGKKWNAETRKVEDIKWTPKRGEVVKCEIERMIFICDYIEDGDVHGLCKLYYYKGAISVSDCMCLCRETELLPSTYEDRCEFFKALTEAGWKYNSKKVELKKVEKGFKDGEFVYWENTKSGGSGICIAKSYNGENNDIPFHVHMSTYSGSIFYDNYIGADDRHDRLATPAEKQKLLDALKKEGKTWNEEKKRIEDVKPGFDFSKLKRGDFISFKSLNFWHGVFDRIDGDVLLCISATSYNFHVEPGSFLISNIDQSTIKVLNREI